MALSMPSAQQCFVTYVCRAIFKPDSQSEFDIALQVMYAVCSGSEANDLALRVARANRPGAWHVAVVEGAYHGHTTATLDLSPYKFDGPGGMGKPPHVHVLPCPDVLRYSPAIITCDTSNKAALLCTPM